MVGALISERSRQLLAQLSRDRFEGGAEWITAATQLFLALDVFKFGHLDLDSALRAVVLRNGGGHPGDRRVCFAGISLLFLAASEDTGVLDLLCFPRALCSCGVVLLHDMIMATVDSDGSSRDDSLDTSMDVKMLTQATVAFHVFLQYLRTVRCDTRQLAWLASAATELQRHCSDEMQAPLLRPWMMSVLDCVAHPAAASQLLLHGQRLLSQAFALGLVS